MPNSANTTTYRPIAGPDFATEPQGSTTVIGLLNVLLRYRAMILATAALAVAGAIVYALWQPRTYSSMSSFMPQSRKTGGGNLSGLAAQLGIMVPTGEANQSPAFYVDLVQSRDVLGKAVETRYAVRANPGTTTANLIEFYAVRGDTPALRRDAAIRRLSRDLTAAIIQKTGVVTLAVRAERPEIAQQINQRILDLLNTFNLESRQSQAAAERRFTEQRLDEVRADLRQAEDRLQGFLQGNREYRNSPELAFQQERLLRDVTTRQQLYSVLLQAYEQARIEEVRDTPVITVVEKPEIPLRPNPRGVVSRTLLALLLGAMVGIILALIRNFFSRLEAAESDELTEFAQLREQVVTDLRHPWRALARVRRGVSGDARDSVA